MLYLEYFMDSLFFVDLYVSFTSAIETPTGQVEPRLKEIAKVYVKGWFFLDLFATIPTELFSLG